jgi:glycosyltransferase involved in cell wall biosynthesis
MSSGLVPISSRNSAIPEFVPDTCGILTENAQEIAAAIERLYASPEQFLSYSQAAAEYIQTVCSSAQVIPRELSLITEGEEPPGGHE